MHTSVATAHSDRIIGFSGIGHNDFVTLLFVWIIPNGAWVVFPALIMYALGVEIVEGLESATKRKR